jgi:hypothetical protein
MTSHGLGGLAGLAGAIAALGAAGCGEGQSPAARLEAEVDTVDGVQRLHYPASGAPTLAWRLDTAAVIGGYGKESAEYQFDQVPAGGLAGDSDGNLYVLDAAGKRVLGYDSSGAYRGAWGREGGGPGELRMPTGLAVGPGDTLWVLDRSNRRVTLLPLDPGSEPGSLPLPEENSGMSGRISLGDGGFYAQLAVFSFRPGEETGPPPRPLVHQRRDGSPGDTVWTAPPYVFDRIELTSGDGVAVILTARAFNPAFLWRRFSDGTFAVADGPQFDVRFLAPTGEELVRLQRDPLPRATTEADRDWARERVRESAQTSDSPAVRRTLEERLEKMTFADLIPRLTGLAVDERDRLWVGVSEETPQETERIDVYDRVGRLVGEILDPPFFPDLFYGGGLAAHLTRDELDVQQIVVARLVEE